jgi:excisionase family DNA binding protein
MRRQSLSVKQLAEELGVHEDTIYRAFSKRTIPGRRVCRILRFDLDRVLRALDRNSRQRSESVLRGAIGGDSRRRARPISPRSVKRGRNFQKSTRRRV